MLSPRRGFVLGCLLAATPLRSLLSAESPPPIDSSLTGQLLVAAPEMDDPRFSHTVILVVQHDAAQGALGLAINQPVGEKTVAELLTAIGEDPGDAQGTIALFAGGPLAPSMGFVVHSGEYRLATTIMLDNDLAVTSTSWVLHDIGAGKGPRKRMMMLGYAGWAPGQLEAELSGRVWVLAADATDLVFDMDRAKVWNAAFERRMVPL